MSDLVEQLKSKYKNGDISVKIIFICVGVYILSAFFNFFLSRYINFNPESFFGVSPGLNKLLTKPWSLLTYFFFHGSIWHLAFNMLALYYIGQMFLKYFRKENFLTFLIFGTIAGALAFMLFPKYLKYYHVLIGASAGVYSIFFALVAYLPGHKIRLLFINIEVMLLHIAYAVLAYDLLMIFSGDNIGGHISHLGGAVFGYFYMKQFEKGNNILGFFKRKSTKSGYRKTRKNPPKHDIPPRNDYDYNSQKVEKQKKVDKILDKISKSGYESLTKDEKDFLFNSSKND